MSAVILKYKKQIQVLNPLSDSKFIYDCNRWQQLHSDYKSLVMDFGNKEITRKDVVTSFKQFNRGEKHFLYPFILTMIWGFGNSGYGTYRTNKYLQSNVNKDIIESAFINVAQQNVEKAYGLLMQINGLNVSYVSKLLYFATRATNQQDYTLIFDLRVARSLVKLLNPEISKILNISPSTNYINFQNYNKLIHQWAKELNVEAENVEMFLFNGEF